MPRWQGSSAGGSSPSPSSLPDDTSALWIHLVAPIPAWLAQPLVEGLLNRVVCLDTRIQPIIPQELLDSRETIRRALEKTRKQLGEGLLG